MIVTSSVTPYFEARYCSQFKPVRNPRIARYRCRVQNVVKFAANFVLIENQISRGFARKRGR
jgi:hypothetical protein